MRTRSLALLALATVVLAGSAGWLLVKDARAPDQAADDALPGFAGQAGALTGIEVRGAGDSLLVSLQQLDGRWEVAQHPGWPTNEREISRALFRLGEARRIQAKTDNPALHARLGVEDISLPAAKGSELRLESGGQTLRLIVGNNHPGLGGSYVRIPGDNQSWLLDADLAPARDPVAWLDRRLVDLPLARTERVRVEPATGRGFVLVREDGNFVVQGATGGSTLDSQASATASVPEQLALDGLADDDGHVASLRHVYQTVDGLSLEIASWQDESGTWARLSLSLDEAQALAWFSQAADEEAPAAQRLDQLKAQVAQWQGGFKGRRFLLPAHKAANLLKTRADHLAQ